jgi:hypothetical protein
MSPGRRWSHECPRRTGTVASRATGGVGRSFTGAGQLRDLPQRVADAVGRQGRQERPRSPGSPMGLTIPTSGSLTWVQCNDDASTPVTGIAIARQ